MSGIVRNVAGFALFGSSFIDKFIQNIFFTKGMIVLSKSPPVLPLTMHETKDDKTEERQTENIINATSEEDLKQELGV